jgi:hypothetical protein
MASVASLGGSRAVGFDADRFREFFKLLPRRSLPFQCDRVVDVALLGAVPEVDGRL